MTAEQLVKALNDLEPGDKIKINGLDVERWPGGVGWTVGEPGRTAGSECLPFIIRILTRAYNAFN